MRRVGGLLLLVALLTSCSAVDGAASKAAPLDRSWPPDSVLTIEEPVAPARDAPHTQATAMAFSRYLVDEVEYALRTTYLGAILRTGTDQWGNRCEVCEHFARLAGELRAERRLHEFDDWEGRVVDVQELEPSRSGDPTAYWQLRLVLSRPETRVLDDRGEVVHTLPAEPRDTVLVVGQRFEEWRIYVWDFVKPAASA